MREIFQQDLEQIGEDLILMATKVQAAITDAVSALETADLALAERVIEADHQIDTIQDHLDSQCVMILARQAPVATDLRVVITGLRLSQTLERMGDLARHVAEVARGRFPELALPETARPLFSELGAAAVSVAADVHDLLEGRDIELAQQVVRDDDRLDALHKETFRLVLADSAAAADMTPQQIVDITLMGRYLERFGDHGVAVARRIQFLVTGEASFNEAAAPRTRG